MQSHVRRATRSLESSGERGSGRRARATTRPGVSPFLRWAGSKRRILEKLLPCVPSKFETYHEPFLGGGSLYFALQPDRARLSDLNPNLIQAYLAVRDGVERVIEVMETFRYSRRGYYHLRDRYVPENRWQRAARFISLNKMCWNGLYRVNSKGIFNVPFGSLGCPNFLDPVQLKNASGSLQDALIECHGYETSIENIGHGDFVFLDPPYVTSHNNNGFAEYNSKLFRWDDQVRLLSFCRAIVDRGATFLMTNAAHSSIEQLYSEFQSRRFRRSSTIANDSAYRGLTEEVLIVGG